MRMPVPAVVLLFLVALAAPAMAWDAGKAGPDELLELRDEGLIARLWDALHPDSLPPPGEYQVLLPPSSQSDQEDDESDAGAFILRNGTMVGRLDRAAWEHAAAHSRGEKVVTWREDWEEPLSENIPTLWESLRPDLGTLMEWTYWPSGLEFAWNGKVGSVKGANPQFIEQLDFTWTQKPFRHFLLGAGLHRTQFGGGLVRRERLDRMPDFFPVEVDTPGYWSPAWWWWSLSAGVPGAKYTLYLADRPLPAYFWMESKAAALTKDREKGDVVTQWTDEDRLSRPGNLAQSLDVRLGHARYRVHWDGDAYATAVHAFELDELPAFIGEWGIGLLTAGGVAATHAWLDLAHLSFSLGRPVRYPTDFRMAFLRVSMAYRSEKNYQLGLALNVRLDNPILSFPGAPP